MMMMYGDVMVMVMVMLMVMLMLMLMVMVMLMLMVIVMLMLMLMLDAEGGRRLHRRAGKLRLLYGGRSGAAADRCASR